MVATQGFKKNAYICTYSGKLLSKNDGMSREKAGSFLFFSNSRGNPFGMFIDTHMLFILSMANIKCSMMLLRKMGQWED